MATLDTSYVRKELKAIIASSRAVARLVQNSLEALEADPSQFPEIEFVPPDILRDYPAATLRKVYIEHDRHSFRLIVAHWAIDDAEDHVDVLYAFRRKAGYPIDWRWVNEVLRQS